MLLLKVENLQKTFGGLKALDGCSLEVERGTCTGIIGPNGSGKTTLLNVVNGYYKPEAGRVFYDGCRIDGLSPSSICRLGVGRVFQITHLFNRMTVLENVLVQSVWLKKNVNEMRAKAVQLIQWLGLTPELKDELASRLSGGQQKLVDIARALMSDPQLLLLDEPLAGVHATIKERIISIVRKLQDEGKTVLFVSHDIPSVMAVSTDVAFMNAGKVIVKGKPMEVKGHLSLIEAYLGA